MEKREDGFQKYGGKKIMDFKGNYCSVQATQSTNTKKLKTLQYKIVLLTKRPTDAMMMMMMGYLTQMS